MTPAEVERLIAQLTAALGIGWQGYDNPVMMLAAVAHRGLDIDRLDRAFGGSEWRTATVSDVVDSDQARKACAEIVQPGSPIVRLPNGDAVLATEITKVAIHGPYPHKNLPSCVYVSGYDLPLPCESVEQAQAMRDEIIAAWDAALAHAHALVLLSLRDALVNTEAVIRSRT